MSQTTTETPEVDGGQEPQPEAPALVEAVEKQPAESEVAETAEEAPAPVSYTHLTLPTILRV